MTQTAPNVIVIPPKPELAQQNARQRQLRAAAYCRVSTDDEEQLTSIEAQQTYYTDKIMTNPNWTMAGIFADQGITGTMAKKRPEFLRMIRQCRQGKIDLVLCKSISRFARNTVDCLNYIRVLRELGVAVLFEKENINTLETDSEMLLTLMGAFAQAESESISKNVSWGIRQAMREGKAVIQYKRLYAYERGEDGRPKVIPEQAEVVRRIYDSFLAGHSIRMIQAALEAEGISAPMGGNVWSEASIRGILKSEKYCGDVLMQKTFTTDCITKKQVKNTGQLPMYLQQDHHEAIVSRETFHAAAAEFARRNAGRGKKQTPTGKACYSAKYALTERLICGECGTLYRRCVWTARGEKRAVWRCASRLDYGKTYCQHSPTLREDELQAAILRAIGKVMSGKASLVDQITDSIAMETAPGADQTMSLGDVERRMEELKRAFQRLFALEDGADHDSEFEKIAGEMSRLKEQKAALLEWRKQNAAAGLRAREAEAILRKGSGALEWNEDMVRQLVDTVKVVSAGRIVVRLADGQEIEQEILENEKRECAV